MFTKKITHYVILLLCIGELSPNLAVESNDAQVSALPPSQEADIINEHTIIATGGASYGAVAVTGPACVVTKRRQLTKVRPGDIVVAHEINSLWHGGLRAAKGIIIEKGDSNHALALGKKWGIPVIVGVTGATKNIIDGQMITCDPVTRNVYHVAYPDRKEFQFDALHMPLKDNKPQLLHDKLLKIGNAELPDATTVDAKDYNIQSIQNRDIFSLHHNTQPHQLKRITKDIYFSHFKRFKEFVLSEKTWFERTKWWGGGIEAVEAGARKWEGCDPFAVDCICIGESFMESKEADIVKILQEIGQSERYLAIMDRTIELCSEKPRDANRAALHAYLEHINAIDIPADVKKEDLIEHPREYKKIEARVDKKEREKLVATGYFVRYLVKKKLLTKAGIL